MDIIDRVKATASSPDVSSSAARQLLASEVRASRYALLDLTTRPRSGWGLAIAGREECAPDYLLNRARYPFHVVEYITAGHGEVRLGDQAETQRIGPGTVFANAPSSACWLRSDSDRPLVKYFFCLTGRAAGEKLAEAGLAQGVIRQIGNTRNVLNVAEEVITEGQRQSPRGAAICLKLVELLLLRIADQATLAESSNESSWANFLRCKSLIDAHTAALRTLDEVAEAAELDPSSICRLFRRFADVSPYRYLMRRKMMLAATELIDSGRRVQDVAETYGFTDPFHFARCFKAVHGVSPSSVRQFHRLP